MADWGSRRLATPKAAGSTALIRPPLGLEHLLCDSPTRAAGSSNRPMVESRSVPVPPHPPRSALRPSPATLMPFSSLSRSSFAPPPRFQARVSPSTGTSLGTGRAWSCFRDARRSPWRCALRASRALMALNSRRASTSTFCRPELQFLVLEGHQ